MQTSIRYSSKYEGAFFFVMSIAITVTVVAAFGLFFAAGLSSFHAPLWVHVHAVTFMSWVFLYLLQNGLVFQNDIALHRKLGWLGAGLAVWMVIVGLATTYLAAVSNRTPPVFTQASLFALNLMMSLTFGVLALAAMQLRKKTDWHRRLMLCATICVFAPALGRILVLLEARTHSSFMLLIMAWVLVAMTFDYFVYRKIHRAYFWGLGAIMGMGFAIALLPNFQPFVAFANSLSQ